MSGRTSFVRLFMGFLFSVTGVLSSCPVELSPPSVVVKYGDSVSINCSTSETDFDGMGLEATEAGTGLQADPHLTWDVASLTNWDVSLSCFFSPSLNSSLEQCYVKENIVLYTFPENISISSNATSGNVMAEKKEYIFTCDIYNIAPLRNLTVRWYKGDAVIHNESFDNIKTPVNQSSILRFKPTPQDNGVTFRCEAHLDLRPVGPYLTATSQEYSIEVHYGPVLNCSTLEILEGETLMKHCSVRGNPLPFTNWLKDGQHIDPSGPLTRENAGLYTVTAEGYSFNKTDLLVYVLFPPELQCQSNYSTQENALNTLTCNVYGYPKPNITWYRDDEEVEIPERLTRSDAGRYLVMASNKLSNVTHTVDITVLYPPSEIVELEDSEVRVASDITLKCSSTGNPRPQYSWSYYRTANVREENDDGVSLLIIQNATAYNMGSYTCYAWNGEGNVTKTARVTVKGATQECPLEITPDRMVIRYKDPVPTVKCTPYSEARNLVRPVQWMFRQDTESSAGLWPADINEDWDARPACVATFRGLGACKREMNFTLYKTPDSVSVSLVDNSTSLVAKKEFQLQCDITNVAPARNLIVRWYRGNETLFTNGSVQVTGCQPVNSTNCDIKTTRSPLNVSATISVALNRTHNVAEFRCEAQLDLQPDRSLPLLNMSSIPLKITVKYKPIIKTLPKIIPVFPGYSEDLVCEAEGHPPPKIQWSFSTDKTPHMSGNTLTVTEAGIYNCCATNEVDGVYHEVEVILKEDYLPLIAGFVAVTVVVISVVFVFIYSIYYKNTRMRRYNLKNPKLSTHNGNVAHNGWDQQFPMTKLS